MSLRQLMEKKYREAYIKLGYAEKEDDVDVNLDPALEAVKELLLQKQKEIGDNDEWQAIDLVKELLKITGAKPFRAYLRCIAPSEACFSCQHILPCRALNESHEKGKE